MPAWQRALSDRVAADVVLSWVVAAATYLVVVMDTPAAVRFAVGGTALFVLPGYVIVAILFPHRGPVAAAGRLSSPRGIDSVTPRERFALAFGLSLATLPVLGIAVAVSPWGFSEIAVTRAFVAFVGVGGLLAAVARRRLPPEDRFRMPLARWAGELRSGLWNGSPVDRAVNVLVVLSVLVALVAVGGALALPQDGQTYTEFAVLSEDGDGDLVTGNYPDELDAGESATLVTAVENEEDEQMDYTVVVTHERVGSGGASGDGADGGEGGGDGTAGTDGSGTAGTTDGAVELQRYDASVEPGERWTHRHQLAPSLSGDRVRVDYYLYRGDAPADPDAESAYRHVYLWLSVADGAA